MQPTRDHLTEALFAPVDVRVYSSPIDESQVSALRSLELAATTSMAPSRLAEFATARACARAALADLGTDAAIPKRDGGSPQWPDGFAGSISHTRGYCLAVTGGAGATLGIDVEEVHRMSDAVERRVLVEVEREALADLDIAARQERVATIFAAKEAFYKAHYEIDPRFLRFDVVAVEVTGDDVRFLPSSGDVTAAVVARAAGRFRIDEGRVIVGVTLEA